MKTLTCEICSMSVDYEPTPGLTSVPCWYCPNPVAVPDKGVQVPRVPLARRAKADPRPAGPKVCPACGLVNTPHAAACDCGYLLDRAAPTRTMSSGRPTVTAVLGFLVAAAALVRFLFAMARWLSPGE